MAFLELLGVGKSFTGGNGKTFEALKNVDLAVEEGQFISIIGHSGCGKSTVLNLIAGLLPISAGRIEVAGVPVKEPGPDRMVAFQNHSLLPWLTLRQNIRLAVDQVQSKESSATRAKIVDEYLSMVNLTAAADRLPDQVSGGMKQRCGIARALCVKPKVLLLDEPFGALDALTRANLQDQLVRIWEEHRITVVMITHDVDEALLLSDRIVMMSNGPSARVAEVMTVELPRPRDRLKAVDHPSYYKQRGELLYFLNKCKKAKVKPTQQIAMPDEGPDPITGIEKKHITVGFVPLVDCAPFAVAEVEGFFEEQGLKVTLSREPSWAAIADGIREGRLDAAQMIAGMPLSLSLGAGGVEPLAVTTAMVLSRGGNAITFGNDLILSEKASRTDLKEKLDTSKEPPIFGMVHPASMHNLLLRAWLAEGGINSETDLKLRVIPPPQMISNLKRGTIAGYCVGEPWNVRAVREKLGQVCATDVDIWPDHPEKVLGVSTDWATRFPTTHRALIKALLKACKLADEEKYRTEVLAELLTEQKYIGGEKRDYLTCLRGPYTYGPTDAVDTPRVVRFFDNEANQCGELEFHWVLAQMARWGLVPYPGNAVEVVQGTLMLDLLKSAGRELEMSFGESSTEALQIGGDPPFSIDGARGYLKNVLASSKMTIDEETSSPDVVELLAAT